MRIAIEEKHVFTCAMATARFLARQLPNGTAYVIGESGLMNAIHSNGNSIVDSHADYAIVGEGRNLSFEMVERAVQLIMEGAKLIATNLDPNCPTSTGMRPGCGAVVALSSSTTRNDLKDYAFRPDLVVDSIADLLNPSPTVQTQLEEWLPADVLVAAS